MHRLKPGVDIVLDILKIVAEKQSGNQFSQSILMQYQERGGLSKKQLEGLYGKAKRIPEISQNKLATLEAIILRKHEKQKSDRPANTPLYQKDEEVVEMIESVLSKNPQHKRVLFLKSKVDSNSPLSPVEVTELKKFHKLLK
jgi:DNA repair protein RadC